MKKIIIGLFVAAAIVVSCSITKKNDLDKDVKFVLSHFQTALSKSDEELFKIFRSSQKKEELIKAIRILQNKDSLVKVNISFSNAPSFKEDQYFVIELPVELNGKGEANEKSKFSIKIFRKDHTLYIAHLEAENLYRQFNFLKSRIEFADEVLKSSAQVKIFYDRARELQKNCDTVVWFTEYNGEAYYYAVNGSYLYDSINTLNPLQMEMGLINKYGKIIIPLQFDLIGNPGITFPDLIEVRKQNKVGYFSMAGEEVIPVKYDWVYPYKESGIQALVKIDSIFGWLDETLGFHSNFPSAKEEKFIREFGFLTRDKITFGKEYQHLIKIPNIDPDLNYRTSGIIVTPAYFQKYGVFKSIISGFVSSNVDNFMYNYGNDYIENTNEKPFSISESLDALISTFKTRYIGGRNEFYVDHRISFLDKKQNLVASIAAQGGKNFQFRRLNEILFESKYEFESFEPNDYPEVNFPSFSYFKFDGKNLEELNSRRMFRFTEFIKMDSSYLTGDFITFTYSEKEGAKQGKSKFASKETIEFIRDEILVSYGFVFPDASKQERFSYYLKDKTPIQSYEDVYAMASEIDKYNLDFLAKILGSFAKPS